MRVPQSGLRLDSPAWPLLQAHITYWGVTDANGNVLGTTIVCGNLALEPSYIGLAVKVLDGNAAGQVRAIATHPAGTNTLTVADPFTDNAGAVVQIVASTRFVILSIAGGGAAPPPVAPSIGLWMFGVCDPGMVASTITIVCPNLAGFPNDIFSTVFWMQVIHNADNPGNAPEREIRQILNYTGATGTFITDAFSANVEANDLVCIFHESIMAIELLGWGTLTTSSTTVPADIVIGLGFPWVNDDYYNGCLLMPTEGNCRFQPRRIVDFTLAGGIFTLDPNNPFSQAPGLVSYILIADQTEFIPAADATINRTPADVIGGKADTPAYAVDAVSSIVRYLKGILNSIRTLLEPSRSLVETWQDVLGIDPTVWTTVNPATGTAWAAPTEVGSHLYARTAPNANETARLRSVQQWVLIPTTPNLNVIVKKTILEWELVVSAPANLDNALCIFGFTNDPNDNRGSANLIGFGLSADVLQSITDLAGVETTNTGFGETLTNHNKLRIEVYEGYADFYINEVRVAQHQTNLPAVPSYIQFFIDTEGTGACTISIGITRCVFEFQERY